MILFSFIIPVYNVEKYLRECLNSIINQTYKNWEVILIDDGSQDNSDKICDEYAIKDKRIKVWHRENEGSLMARRCGVLYAKGDYFLFIDSDDLVNSKLLEVMNKIIESTGSDMVIYRFERFGRLIKSESPKVFEKGTIVGEGGLSKECIWKKVISGDELNNLCLKVVSRDIIDKDIDYQAYAFMKSGTDFMQSMILLDNAKKIYFTDEVLYYYRYNDSGISSTKAKTVDSKSLQLHMKTREVLQNKKLYYLNKNGYDSIENLQLFYKNCFITKIDQIISWISNVKEKKKKINIIKFALDEKLLDKGKRYLEADLFTQRYKKLFLIYIKKNKDKICCKLIRFSNYRKLVSLINYMIICLRKRYKE